MNTLKQNLLISLIFLQFVCLGQTSYKAGYFINDNGQKVECLIKDMDWGNNPNNFKYKLSPQSEPEIAVIDTIREFGIDSIIKFIRRTVNVDVSSIQLKQMGYERSPEFEQKEVFLRVLLEGKANLYQHKEGNSTRYYYKIDTSDIEPLIFKYYKTEEGKLAENHQYRYQLWNNLTCSLISLTDFEGLTYSRKSLMDLFVKYNICQDSEYHNYNELKNEDYFNLTLRAGLNYSSLSIEHFQSDLYDVDFGSAINPRFGVEAEFIIPYTNNKWTFFAEPSFQYFIAKKELSDQTVYVDYQSIEIPLGLRYYFFLKDKSKIFLNAAFVFDFSMESKVDYKLRRDLDVYSRDNLAFGLGYRLLEKYSLEFRYYTNRQILSNYLYLDTEYSTISLIFGYTFL